MKVTNIKELRSPLTEKFSEHIIQALENDFLKGCEVYIFTSQEEINNCENLPVGRRKVAIRTLESDGIVGVAIPSDKFQGQSALSNMLCNPADFLHERGH